MNTSPRKFAHQIKSYERALELAKDEDDINDAKALLEFNNQHNKMRIDLENSDAWKKNNLEYDLRSTEWIINKVKTDTVYAQNLYAALCNNDFKKVVYEDTADNIVSLLKDAEATWSCSWRHAGGIVADILEQGDYMDWYCSGSFNSIGTNHLLTLNDEEKLQYTHLQKYASEGVVTDIIEDDLLCLGWKVILYRD